MMSEVVVIWHSHIPSNVRGSCCRQRDPSSNIMFKTWRMITEKGRNLFRAQPLDASELHQSHTNPC